MADGTAKILETTCALLDGALNLITDECAYAMAEFDPWRSSEEAFDSEGNRTLDFGEEAAQWTLHGALMWAQVRAAKCGQPILNDAKTEVVKAIDDLAGEISADPTVEASGFNPQTAVEKARRANRSLMDPVSITAVIREAGAACPHHLAVKILARAAERAHHKREQYVDGTVTFGYVDESGTFRPSNR